MSPLAVRQMKELLLDQIPLTRWLELVDSVFMVRNGSVVLAELNLIRVEQAAKQSPGCPGPTAPNIESFSLIFQGPSNRALRQNTYRLEQSNLGEFDLFVVPVARGANTWEYEAVFNRLVKAA